ncbi:MAG: ABC transporter substrate-binding protein [Actinomycetota bacterium]
MRGHKKGEPYGRVRIDGRGPHELDRYMAGMERVTLSRRGFLRAAVVTPAAGFLAACSKRVAPGGGGGGATTAPPTVELEDELNIYNWALYLNPQTRKDFAGAYGISTTIDFYSSNEELITKLQGGATGYDLVAPTGYAVQIMIDEGLLLELDHERLPNLANVDPRFLGLAFDSENKYSAPKDWGTTGFMYVSDKVEEEMTSWADFYQLAEKYSGKYTVLDSAPEVVGSALKMLGYGYNTTDEGEIDEALEQLIAIKPHLSAILSSGYREMIQRGESYVALGWNGDYFYTLEDQPSTKYVIPSEGTEFWVDTWAIPASAPHPNIALEFINWVLTPENQGRETNFTYYASAVAGAADFTDPAIASDPAIYPAAEVTDQLEANNGDALAFELRSDAWTKFKSA